MKKEYYGTTPLSPAKQKGGEFAVMLIGAQTPSATWETYEQAEAECKRLCSLHRKNGYILKVVAKAEVNDITVTKV